MKDSLLSSSMIGYVTYRHPVPSIRNFGKSYAVVTLPTTNNTSQFSALTTNTIEPESLGSASTRESCRIMNGADFVISPKWATWPFSEIVCLLGALQVRMLRLFHASHNMTWHDFIGPRFAQLPSFLNIWLCFNYPPQHVSTIRASPQEWHMR